MIWVGLEEEPLADLGQMGGVIGWVTVNSFTIGNSLGDNFDEHGIAYEYEASDLVTLGNVLFECDTCGSAIFDSADDEERCAVCSIIYDSYVGTNSSEMSG